MNIISADSRRREGSHRVIDRPQGSGDYLFLHFQEPMQLRLRDTEQVTEPNACLLLAPREPHYFCGHPTFLNSYVHFHRLPEGIDLPLNRVFHTDDAVLMDQLVLELRNEFLQAHPFREEMTELLLRRLLLLFARCTLDRAGAGTEESAYRSQFEQLRLEMLSNPAHPWRIDELAGRLNLSRSRFYDYYALFFHTSPKAELMKQRMEYARLRLTNRGASVSEVAEEAGFSSLPHFSRYYKRYFGISPKETKW